LVRVVRVKKPRVARGIIWPVDSLVLSYQLRVLRCHERYAKTETLGVEAPVFQVLSNLRIF
jgi:hypothetical protein